MVVAEFDPSAWNQLFGLILASLALIAVTIISLCGKKVPWIIALVVLVAFIALGVAPSAIRMLGFEAEFRTLQTENEGLAADVESARASERLASAKLGEWERAVQTLEEELTNVDAEVGKRDSMLAAAQEEIGRLLASPSTDPVVTYIDEPSVLWSSWATKDQKLEVPTIGLSLAVVAFHWERCVRDITTHYEDGVTVEISPPEGDPYREIICEFTESRIGLGAKTYVLSIAKIEGDKYSDHPQVKLSLQEER
ncbi:MAG: hypothetical protein IID40_01410 [Planctomycetes bacterium]|nr:hypothetical protein [Planctomycetota bacterium]